jgi:hypothetical protein
MAMMLNSDNLITKELRIFSQSIDPRELFPALMPEAADLVIKDPYAFTIATCLDRGAKAEVIWTIPYDIQNTLGHLDPFRIYQMSLDELAILEDALPLEHPYIQLVRKNLEGVKQKLREGS